MRRATLYMTRCKVARAWSGWQHGLAMMQHKRQLAHHAMAFLLQRTQKLALEQWKAIHQEAQQEKEYAQIADVFYRQRRMGASISVWHKKATKERRKWLQNRSAQTLQLKWHFDKPFMAWRSVIVRLELGRQTLVASLYKLLHGEIYYLFYAWHEVTTQRCAKRNKLRRAVDRFMHAHRVASFQAWRDAVRRHHQTLALVSNQHLGTLQEQQLILSQSHVPSTQVALLNGHYLFNKGWPCFRVEW